jgi:pimeloyl-ACP methyl ester carboxylesterase
MPTVSIDGIATHYEVLGSGPPVLMNAPGGFDATIEKWRTQGVYASLKFLERLPESYSCIVFDRRECGESGGRVERVGWREYAAQGSGLLDHLGIEEAHVMGGCMGCSVALAFAVAHPQRTRSLVLFWPVGGARYRIRNDQRFAEHQSFVRQNGLAAVAELAQREGKTFGADPRVGPWASVLRRDAGFRADYVRHDVERYVEIVADMGKALVDRDTSPGAETEELMRLDAPTLIVPGSDHSHATSAARYLAECLPRSEYFDLPVKEQTEEGVNARVLHFLAGIC